MHLTILIFLQVFDLILVSTCSPDREGWDDYPPFNELKTDCFQRLKCSDPGSGQGGTSRRCDCDETCLKYGTCCLDSPYLIPNPNKASAKQAQCTEIYASNQAMFMVSRCSPSWRDRSLIRSFCESAKTSEWDPLAVTPVTNYVSNITYRNYFCSVCNFDHQDAYLWNIILSSTQINTPPGTEWDAVVSRLEYDRVANKWGIWSRDNNDSFKFYYIDIAVRTPPELSSLVKYCETGLESRCSRSWRDETVRAWCQSYILPVGFTIRSRTVQFKNPHCAMCNYVTTFKNALCVGLVSAFGGPPHLSFTLLLDVNPASGDNTCSESEVYDPFFKKCRALACALPGYGIKDGKCVKQ